MLDHLPLIIAASIAALRLLRALQPLIAVVERRVPALGVWLPLVVLLLGHLVEHLAGARTELDVWVVVAQAAALLAPGVAVATQGPPPPPPAPRQAGTLLVLLVLLAGCGSPAATVCSPAASEALTLVCEDAIEHAPTTKDAEDIHDGCVALVRSRSRRCR